ncbi:hypothetical protein LTR36_010159 [Oleoguttula mirabilis]|uniref:Zn(2)-C6 fungal-type domain-containing protein n=1 Tax=Oleoguttula mirabilis TaxID=1507867 RepID=A0AAV9JS77_9PEZI|nr:hypothetical protein LTR36_010159 [Oleoguttula mirabilis]
MAEAITIPSPSVFLRASPPPPSPPPPPRTTAQHVRRQSSEAKKKASRKSSGVAGGTAGNGRTAKPKQSKSRNGCVTCKTKRLKCDEEKPACQQCKKRNVDCGGYKKDYKWRPFEETNVKVNIDRQKRASPPVQTSADPTQPTTPLTEEAPVLPPTQSEPSLRRKDSKRPSTADEDHAAIELPQRPVKAKRKSRARSREETPKSPIEPQPEPTPPPDEDETTFDSAPSLPVISETSNSPAQTSSLVRFGLSPTLTEILFPFSDDGPDDGDLINFSLPEGMQYPLTPAPVIDPALLEEDVTDGEVEDALQEDVPYDDLALFQPSRRQTPSCSGSITSAEDVYGSWNGPISYLYTQPYFAQDSPEMLTFRFDRLTCGILSVMDGPHENPWRNLIWPLAQESPALYHAVIAMTAFHSSTDVSALRVVGHEHKQASIRYIQEGIRDHSMTDQTAIATALALGFSESWDQHTASGNTHIKGAQALVKRALANHQRDPLSGVELARLKFLCNAWVYMDVIARLTSVDSDESNDFDNTFFFASDPPNMVMGDSGPPGFGIDFGTGIDARLDPLMGCANTLFPLIGRVANLVRRVCRSQNNSPAVISQANDLKLALEAWDPPAYIERPEDPTTDVQHTLQTAEAYRWATLCHLHQSVPELPCSSSAELAQRALQYLATVPLASRTVIVQIYPLMVAGCEASTAEDRQWVRDRWAAMNQRMRIGVIDKSATVTEEVWRRRDTYEAQPTTRRKLVATADLHPARQRGAPLAGMQTGVGSADPGRTGMVFSYVEADGDAKQTGESDRWPTRPNMPSRVMGAMDPAYTVRGHLHWVGVMWDWGWEVLLG